MFIWLHWVFISARGLSLVVASRLLSSCAAWASHCSDSSCCTAWALGHPGCSICSMWAQELHLRALVCRLNSWGMGLDILGHVGSSRTRDMHYQTDSPFFFFNDIVFIYSKRKSRKKVYQQLYPWFQVYLGQASWRLWTSVFWAVKWGVMIA